jgi:tRNA modification GTPase
MSDTIYALSTARGKAGVAVVRVSGPAAQDALASFGVGVVTPRRASLRALRKDGEVIDTALVLLFEAEKSFTGEQVVELQLHGSEAVLALVLRHLAGLRGFRAADPGEFTRRALENGRLDLTQVEGLADLIEAETEAQRKQAQRVLSGALGKRVALWRADLIRAAALIELTIDFVDEDVPLDVTPEVREIVDRLLSFLQAEIAGSQMTERIRAGFEVAIIGAPNVGKSTLINALAGREVAITSPVAGTTRDIIEVRLDLGGIPVTLLDTAGLRETDDLVEKIGVSKARSRSAEADLRIVLLEPDSAVDDPLVGPEDIVVWTKADLVPGGRSISALTGVGLDWLIDEIGLRLRGKIVGDGLLIRERHRLAIGKAIEYLVSARDMLYSLGQSLELVAADLRAASHELGSLVGSIGVETLLDEIFSRFCIGK